MKSSRITVESSRGRTSHFARGAVCSLFLAGLVLGGAACQSPTPGTCPMRAILPSQRELPGTVTGPDGRPVQSVVVAAYEARPEYLFAGDNLHPIGQQTTGPDGAFRFHVSQDTAKVYLVARKPGLGLGWTLWRKSPPSGAIVVQMAAPAEIAGQVVGPDRKPVPGATVSVAVGERRGDYASLGSRISCLTTRTDDLGRFRFQGLPAAQAVHFEVAAEDHGLLHTISSQDDGYLTGQTKIELQLPPGSAVEATVVSKDTGKPVRDVKLLLYARSINREILGTPVPGSPGHFRWTGISPGTAVIFLATPREGPLSRWSGIRQVVEVKSGTAANVKIELSSGQAVDVRVCDAATSQPVEGTMTGMFSPAQKSGSVGSTDRHGIARMLVVPGEYQYTWAEAPGYREYHGQKPVTVQPGEPFRLDVTLERSPCYQGTVVDADGKPLFGVQVTILGESARCISDAKGHFALYPPLYQTDRTPSMTIVARHELANLAAAVEATTPDTPLQIRLQSGLVREVAVVDPDGRPVADAAVTAVLGHCDARPEGGRFQAHTDQAGRCTLRALPAGRPLTLCVQATGFVAQARLLPAGQDASTAAQADSVQLQRVQRLATGPVVKEIRIPSTPHEDSIWGATGRDSRGHIWFSVSKANRPGASAQLFELLPDSGQVIDRGNVLDELKKANLLRPDEQQMKIHSKIYEVDGYLYYVSMDEKGEDEQKLAQPVFGSHLWRLHLADNTWEHLLTIPEAMIGIAVGGGKVYAIGYWDHVLYQYDIATKAARHIKVGACFGHVSRNLIADSRGHVYLPRCTQAAGMLQASLVEYDDQLREAGSSPLPMYYNGTANWSYGITALQPLPDGAIALLTHNGWLTLIRPQEDGPAKVEQLGWFHPDGSQMADTLFVDKTGRYLMGAAQNSSRLSDWVTYDLQTGQRTMAPFSDGQPDQPSWGRVCLYGSLTRDDLGNCYVVGQTRSHDAQDSRPLLLQVNPSGRVPAPAAAAAH